MYICTYVCVCICLHKIPYLSASKDFYDSDCEQGTFSSFACKIQRFCGSFCTSKLLDLNLFDDGTHDIA